MKTVMAEDIKRGILAYNLHTTPGYRMTSPLLSQRSHKIVQKLLVFTFFSANVSESDIQKAISYVQKLISERNYSKNSKYKDRRSEQTVQTLISHIICIC